MKTNNWQAREQKITKRCSGHQEDGRSVKFLLEVAQKRAKGELNSQKKNNKKTDY